MIEVHFAITNRPKAELEITDQKIVVDTRVFGRKNPFKTQYESENLFLEEFNQYLYKRSFAYICWHLSKRSLRINQAKELLRSRLVPDKISEKVVLKCIEQGFLNDTEWVVRFIQKELKKGFGPKMIRAKLCAVGFSKLDASQEDLLKTNREEELKSLLDKKFPENFLEDQKLKDRAIRFALRKGYDYETFLNAILTE